MEIKSNPIICPNCGNYYNPSVHAVCPNCGQSSESAAGSGLGPTEPAGAASGNGSFIKTEAPFDAQGSQANPGGASFVKTEPPFPGGSNANSHSPFQPTMIGGGLGVEGGSEPVVGWLVCIDGPVRGNDYRLHAGYNYIGREIGDVRISGDQQISRQNHAMIAFDESENIYYVGPSAGRNLIKVNNKTVLNAVQLNNYDVISIGTTKLIFVALCGDHFSWKEG
ncbi:MAG: FHA domain-containing protein [Lachnospiraceae bacterium]|nr:FHA domain-containing protein [Lachnospiraceae bacterium]